MRSDTFAKTIMLRTIISTAALLFFFITVAAQQQQSWSPVDNGRTAAYVMSSATAMNEINLYNGRVSLKIPIGTIGGRGQASYQPTVSISRTFVLRRVNDWMQGSGQWSAPILQLIAENYQDSYDFSNFQPGLLPAVMFGRKTRNANPGFSGSVPPCSKVTKLFVRLPGSQVELRDNLTGGEPDSSFMKNRGRDWHSVDGSGMFFKSDTDIIDETCSDNQWLAMNGGNVIYPTGYLMMKDGTRYRFVDGMPKWMRDRNGNTIKFTGTSTVTDSINRQYSLLNGFTYTATDGTARTVSVIQGQLSTALRSDFAPGGVKTETQLFPSIASSQLRCANCPFDPNVVKAIRLPNNLEYKFFYNTYGEVARIEMPSGGVVEYEYDGFVPAIESPQIRRFVTEKRVYSAPGALAARQTFVVGGTMLPGNVDGTITTVKTFDAANNVVRHERHTFKGNVAADASFTGWYQKFDNGQEIAVEILNDTGSTVLERTDNTYATLDMNGVPFTVPEGVQTHPTNLDCALTETKVKLNDTNQLKRTTFNYDGRTNQTDVYEYDIGTAGSGVAGPLVRRSHTDFVSDTAYTSTAGPYLISLPSQQWVSSDAAGNNKLSLTTFEYDAYHTNDTRHALLLDRPSIAGLCLKLDDTLTPGCLQVSDTNYIQRGNLTQTNAYSNIAGSVIVRNSTQYDIAGNQVKTIDGRLNATTIGYADAFGVADGEAQANAAPSQLGTLKAFAFATSTTNALNHISYVQYNFHSGLPVDQEDPNGVITTVEYGLGAVGGADPLDRISKIIKAVNSAPAKTATSYVYDDANHMITTTNDLAAYDDKLLKEEKIYDGLGRFIETRKYETPTTYLTTKFEFDALGRPKRTYNPHRTTADETYGWTDTSYDLQGRTTIVQTFDKLGASTGITQNAHSGTLTLITDQAGKKQLTQTGILGIVKVWEITPADAATTTTSFAGQSLTGYLTEYEYDGRGKLTKVTQGTQAPRVLAYDGLGRLTDTTFPENGHVSYGYDGSGNLNSKTDARNVVTTMVYDSLNRLQTRSYSDGSPTYTYSYDTVANFGVGQLASVTSSVSTYAMTDYDALGRVTASTQTVDGTDYTMSYQYNRAGALTLQTYPSGKQIRNEYDGGGRVAGVKKEGTTFYYAGAVATDATNRIQYSSFGKMQGIKLGNGLWEHSSFNSRSQAVQIALGTSITDSSKLKLDLTYGVRVGQTLDTTKNNANVESQTITLTGLTLAQTYTYDELNRLKSATEKKGANDTWKQTYDYDRFGNRRFNTTAGATTLPDIVTNPAVTNPTISTANNQISSAGYAYDQAGNLKCDPEHPCVSGTAYYAYNPENLIKTANGGSGSGGTSYFYDAHGRRVKKVVGGAVTITTVFVYDINGKLLAEYSDAQPTTGGTRYVTADHLGSSRVITDSAQNVKERNDFLPYGEEIDAAIGDRSTVTGYSAPDGLRQKFTSKERDPETGLDFFQARYYASKYGRFTSIDPLDASAKQAEPDTWNRYVYVSNNPLRFIDQDGQIKKDRNGNYVERVVGDKVSTHRGAPGVEFQNKEVRLQTDNGREIEATRRPSASFDHNTRTFNINDNRMSTDCHGLTFTEGKYWINNDQVDTILSGDNYTQLGSGDRARVGDVAVYRNSAGEVVHSATVTAVDSRGRPTQVEGIGGIQPESRATTPEGQYTTDAAAPGVGYSTITYHRKPNETAQEREQRVQTVTGFKKS
ncbi:MAG TPA: RHS repeat-associated core domain-containing protein [Pyrinomonadaceae bacterium]|nr:RHS repeat-associated core domain-containing protein [Pyrinomonadaceae bacterium]